MKFVTFISINDKFTINNSFNIIDLNSLKIKFYFILFLFSRYSNCFKIKIKIYFIFINFIFFSFFKKIIQLRDLFF